LLLFHFLLIFIFLVAATGAKFHFRDLENDELLDKFVSFVNEGLEPIAEDAVAGDAFTDK